MSGRLRAWVVWWVLCAALWLALVDRVPRDELVAGALVAALGATLAVALRSQRVGALRVRARWLAGAGRPLLGLAADLVPLARALVGRGILRRQTAGALTELPFDAVGEDAEQAGYRVLTI